MKMLDTFEKLQPTEDETPQEDKATDILEVIINRLNAIEKIISENLKTTDTNEEENPSEN